MFRSATSSMTPIECGRTTSLTWTTSCPGMHIKSELLAMKMVRSFQRFILENKFSPYAGYEDLNNNESRDNIWHHLHSTVESKIAGHIMVHIIDRYR